MGELASVNWRRPPCLAAFLGAARLSAPTFNITQEFMAYMLGVRRAGVTRAANSLRKRKLIRYNRGRLTILDGRDLEAAACGCYAVIKDTYAQTLS